MRRLQAAHEYRTRHGLDFISLITGALLQPIQVLNQSPWAVRATRWRVAPGGHPLSVFGGKTVMILAGGSDSDNDVPLYEQGGFRPVEAVRPWAARLAALAGARVVNVDHGAAVAADASLYDHLEQDLSFLADRQAEKKTARMMRAAGIETGRLDYVQLNGILNPRFPARGFLDAIGYRGNLEAVVAQAGQFENAGLRYWAMSADALRAHGARRPLLDFLSLRDRVLRHLLSAIRPYMAPQGILVFENVHQHLLIDDEFVSIGNG